MRTLFNSDSFKNAMFKKVKSPTELVAGVLKPGRLTGRHTPAPDDRLHPGDPP